MRTIMNNIKVSPFVKWAGGKRQLMDRILERLPQDFNNYYEPFVGGGAVLFELKPQKASINDINKSLINSYKAIRDFPEEFMLHLNYLDSNIPDEGNKYYYGVREKYNDKILLDEYDVELAALFVFINKHCFNGLYRVNKNGLFNVPYNNSKRGSYEESNILQISAFLRNIEITCVDFEIACEKAEKGDFIFLDSPYAPLNDTSFTSYTKEGFSLESHIRLSKLFDKLTDRGCYCMLTNHNTELIRELYSNKGYMIDVFDVKRMINSKADARTGKEIIICNY